MMYVAITLAASAAFNGAPAMRPAMRSATAKMGFVDSLEGTGEETGSEIWDPIGISSSVSDEAVMWFRAAELKHGRAAMLACVGYLTGAMGMTFPGDISPGTSFASVNADGVYNAWANVPQRAPHVAARLRLTMWLWSAWHRCTACT